MARIGGTLGAREEGRVRGRGRSAPVLALALGLLGGQWIGLRLGLWGFVLCLGLWVLEGLGSLRLGARGGLLLFGAWVGTLLPLPTGGGGKGRGAAAERVLPEGGPLRFVGQLVSDPEEGAHDQLRARLRLGGTVMELLLLKPGREAWSWSRGTWLRGKGFVEPARGETRQLRSVGALLRAVRGGGSAGRLRRGLLAALAEGFEAQLGPRAAALCQRLFLGNARNKGDALLGMHRRLGVSHFLAISGLHTLLLASILAWFLRPLGKRGPGILAALLLFYAWMTGLRPPVLRAVLGYLFYDWCRRRGRTFPLDSAFALSAIATAWAAPQEGAGIGFALSYLAVAGLAWLTPFLGKILQRGEAPPTFKLKEKATSLLLASTAAWIATLPVSLLVFHRASPWGILLSPLLLPLVFLLLLGCLLSLTAPLLPLPLGPGIFAALQGVAWLYLKLLDFLDRLGLPHLSTSPALPEQGLWFLLGAGLCLAAWRASARCFLATCLLSSLLALLPWGGTGGTRAASVTLLPVGDGQCLVVQAEGKVIALDCGDHEGGRRAARALRTFLQEEGLPNLDLLVLSHGDSDHSAGLGEVLETLPIGMVLLPSHPKSAPLLRLLANRGQPHRLLLPGETWEWGQILRTSLPLASADLQSSNDGGLLSWIRLAPDLRLLCMGDQEGETLDRLHGELLVEKERGSLGQGDKLLLLLPHHGAPSEGLFRLVKALRPLALLESSGKRRALRQTKFHQSLGQEVWATGLGGAIRLEYTGAGWLLSEERNRGPFFSSKTCLSAEGGLPPPK